MESRISIVIPALNEEELLPRCLAAVLPQARALFAEVIVVDNGSTDRTGDIARATGARVVVEPRRGVVFALQRGLTEARGAIVAFTDADTVPDPDWLTTISRRFIDPNLVGLTGPIRFPGLFLLTLLRWIIPNRLCGANMAVRRSAALAVGGFDLTTNLTSDFVLSGRIRSQGRVVFDRRLRVTTSARRYQVHPVREGARQIVNLLWLALFKRPLFWHFNPIRTPAEELQRRTRRRVLGYGALLTLITVAYWSMWPSSSVFGQIQVRKHTKQKLVALTFDDGPNGTATRAIVTILLREHAPATFFEVGRSVAADPKTAKFVSDAGFAIGNHSWDHSMALPVMKPGHIAQELQRTEQIIGQATGQTPTFFRPPHGFRSPQLLYEVDRQHLRTVDWSVDPRDYLTGNAAVITARVLKHVKPGSIVLLHDGLQDGPRVRALRNRAGTIEALPGIIEGLRARGYTLVPLAQLLPPPAPDR